MSRWGAKYARVCNCFVSDTRPRVINTHIEKRSQSLPRQGQAKQHPLYASSPNSSKLNPAFGPTKNLSWWEGPLNKAHWRKGSVQGKEMILEIEKLGRKQQPRNSLALPLLYRSPGHVGKGWER